MIFKLDVAWNTDLRNAMLTSEAGAGDRARIAALDAVEQQLVDRLCAVAEEHPKVR